MNIGKTVKELRIKKGLNLEELTTKSKISSSFLSKVESGNRKPSFKTLNSLAKAFKTSVPHILLESLSNSDIKSNRKKEFLFLKPKLEKVLNSLTSPNY